MRMAKKNGEVLSSRRPFSPLPLPMSQLHLWLPIPQSCLPCRAFLYSLLARCATCFAFWLISSNTPAKVLTALLCLQPKLLVNRSERIPLYT